MRQLKWLLGLVTQNFGWKLLSLVIAVVLWALVASEPELSTFATVGVEYKNLSDDLEISSDPVSSVRLELRGPSGELRGLGSGGVHPELVLDMSGVQPGERTFPITDQNVKLSRGVTLVRAIPPEVRFRFERQGMRTVKVVPRFSGEGRNGYDVATYSVTPDSMAIIGPASRVARVSAAFTDPVDVSSLAGSSDFRVNVFLEDPYVRFQGPAQVMVAVTMKKR
ncbi:MAG TPA: CdaR family protein [Bryobacteraceae bacterium]|nr:CdaR family protein [Bryobacteraceae bacterium]